MEILRLKGSGFWRVTALGYHTGPAQLVVTAWSIAVSRGSSDAEPRTGFGPGRCRLLWGEVADIRIHRRRVLIRDPDGKGCAFLAAPWSRTRGLFDPIREEATRHNVPITDGSVFWERWRLAPA